jgi:sulfite reductase alpha subunit-like flavoprotein
MSNPRDMRQFVLSTLASAMNLFATQNLPEQRVQPPRLWRDRGFDEARMPWRDRILSLLFHWGVPAKRIPFKIW